MEQFRSLKGKTLRSVKHPKSPALAKRERICMTKWAWAAHEAAAKKRHDERLLVCAAMHTSVPERPKFFIADLGIRTLVGPSVGSH